MADDCFVYVCNPPTDVFIRGLTKTLEGCHQIISALDNYLLFSSHANLFNKSLLCSNGVCFTLYLFAEELTSMFENIGISADLVHKASHIDGSDDLMTVAYNSKILVPICTVTKHDSNIYYLNVLNTLNGKMLLIWYEQLVC